VKNRQARTGHQRGMGGSEERSKEGKHFCKRSLQQSSLAQQLQFKLKLVQLALARPWGHRIRPVCRKFPEVEPVTPTPPRSCPLAPVSALQSLLESCSRAMSPPTRFSCVNGFERSRSRRGSRWGSATRRPRRYQRCRSRSPCRECRACRPRSPSCHPSASPAPRALCPRAAAHRVRMRGEGRRGVKTDVRAAGEESQQHTRKKTHFQVLQVLQAEGCAATTQETQEGICHLRVRARGQSQSLVFRLRYIYTYYT